MRLTCTALLIASCVGAADIGPSIMPSGCCPPAPRPDLTTTVAGIHADPAVKALFAAKGLDVLPLTWEDTGRSKNSAWGPNITDLTIQPVDGPSAPLLPVIRFPNFGDTTADIRLDDLKVVVGNHDGSPPRAISLREYLRDFRTYQHGPTGYMNGPLLAERDTHALVSAQACLLPVPAGGRTRFAPVLFSYQSRMGNPAVLTILATPSGTSAQVIENNPILSAGAGHGQRLFHNADGQRAGLLATRFSDTAGAGKPVTTGPAKAQADGLSCVLVIQVPLVVPEIVPMMALACMEDTAAAAPAMESKAAGRARGMEQAVVAAGPVEGPWFGLNGATIRRDTRFPIRVTVQFYQATDTARVTSADAERISATIHKVYTQADAVGSLVTEGLTSRPTEPAPAPIARPMPVWPQPWYDAPCSAYESTTGRPWQDGLARIRQRLGADWSPADARELENALKLVR